MMYEIRLYLHTVFTDWALSIMPDGPERSDFLACVIPYFERAVVRRERERAKRGGGAAA